MLAPSAKLRALVVPHGPEPAAQAAKPAECGAGCAHHRPVRLSWARLLKRVFQLDLEHCPNCGGELKIIAAILEQLVIEKILGTWVCRRGHHLGRQPMGRSRTWPDHPDPSPFTWPGAQGRGDRLRLWFSGPRKRSQIVRVNP